MKQKDPKASVSDVLSFVFNQGRSTTLLFFLGCLASVGNGLVYPILAYVFSDSFSRLAGAAEDGMGLIREIVFIYMGVGAFAFVCSLLQTGCLETAARRATLSLQLEWFHALLRQDTAFYDIYGASEILSTMQSSANAYKRGIGYRFGEGIQFATTFIGGMVLAFVFSWRVALVVLSVLPFASLAAFTVLVLNQTKSANAAQAYGKAGSVAFSAISSIRTVLSLNAVSEMIRHYNAATDEAYQSSIRLEMKTGLARGAMLSMFMLLYFVLTIFGSYLVYRDVEETGCDPSDSISNNVTCSSSAIEVYGAWLALAFATLGLTQVSNSLETFAAARVAYHKALVPMTRKQGSPPIEIYHETGDKEASNTAHESSEDLENGDLNRRVKAILPAYEIDSLSSAGLKPARVQGVINFQNVSFHYPGRPDSQILEGLDLEIEAGKTVAIVGPSGGGKSTIVSLIERFYDPNAGIVALDGISMRDLNVQFLRSHIGYVGQEPVLFATTIAENIRLGSPHATLDDIQAAARKANAHDFITEFPDGYATHVGDLGKQLSGGQKQRIAIARAIISDPTILLLDEATSSLDSNSEKLVQKALDKVMAERKRTTIVIAHRLSTIQRADEIVVIEEGKVVERGSHTALLMIQGGRYHSLVETQTAGGDPSDLTFTTRNESNLAAKAVIQGGQAPVLCFKEVTFEYPARPEVSVLNKFNLSIQKGETVALVGPSGQGKSTVLSLIERFYDPSDGVVEYNATDIRSLNVARYRDQIGYVEQEPKLFNTSIAKNIALGAPNATLDEIKEAAHHSNAHNFITSFSNGYDTEVGETTQLSTGQKQRIAIARALVRKPKILLLDEATSALDSESEAIVQDAFTGLMASREQTVVVVAHRLSTIRHANQIVFVSHGQVQEVGSHDKLIQDPRGLYRRLVETQKNGFVSMIDISQPSLVSPAHCETDTDDRAEHSDERTDPIAKRARKMAQCEWKYLLIGVVGAVFVGGIYPAWGVIFGRTVDLLFRQVHACDNATVEQLLGYITCQDYYNAIADAMKKSSFRLAAFWAMLAVIAMVGNWVTHYGFGKASERLNKRVRDLCFSAILCQEIGFFDIQSVGGLTYQLENDAAQINTFFGEPVRSLSIALSSIVIGLVLAFMYMWPVALVILACIPFMAYASSIRMKQMFGTDEGNEEALTGIATETLLNMRTVSSLVLEEQRLEIYRNELHAEHRQSMLQSLVAGSMNGLSTLIQQWTNALLVWWGGYLLFNYSGTFQLGDFATAVLTLIFALYGLGMALRGASDRKEAEQSTARVLSLLDRESSIDPLSNEGKKDL